MKTIPLTEGKLAMVDDEDFNSLSKFSWCIGGKFYGHEYAVRGGSVGGKQYKVLMHRSILNAPDDLHVDHIDNDGLNNQKSNLRLCTRSQNLCNQKVHKNNVAQIKGVRRVKKRGKWRNRWQARIQFNNTPYDLGYFASAKEASDAYNEAAIRLHGEFANFNNTVAA